MEVKRQETIVYHVLQADGKNVGSVSLGQNWTIEARDGGFRIFKKVDRIQEPKPSTSGGLVQPAVKNEPTGRHPDFKPVLVRVRAKPEAKREIKVEDGTGQSPITLTSDSDSTTDSESERDAEMTTCLIHGHLLKMRFKK